MLTFLNLRLVSACASILSHFLSIVWCCICLCLVDLRILYLYALVLQSVCVSNFQRSEQCGMLRINLYLLDCLYSVCTCLHFPICSWYLCTTHAIYKHWTQIPKDQQCDFSKRNPIQRHYQGTHGKIYTHANIKWTLN